VDSNPWSVSTTLNFLHNLQIDELGGLTLANPSSRALCNTSLLGRFVSCEENEVLWIRSLILLPKDPRKKSVLHQRQRVTKFWREESDRVPNPAKIQYRCWRFHLLRRRHRHPRPLRRWRQERMLEQGRDPISGRQTDFQAGCKVIKLSLSSSLMLQQTS
jgi:hypothetical protein